MVEDSSVKCQAWANWSFSLLGYLYMEDKIKKYGFMAIGKGPIWKEIWNSDLVVKCLHGWFLEESVKCPNRNVLGIILWDFHIVQVWVWWMIEIEGNTLVQKIPLDISMTRTLWKLNFFSYNFNFSRKPELIIWNPCLKPNTLFMIFYANAVCLALKNPCSPTFFLLIKSHIVAAPSCSPALTCISGKSRSMEMISSMLFDFRFYCSNPSWFEG